MRSAEELENDARQLAAVDVTLLPDATVKAEILALLRTINICYAALWKRVASFDRRDLAARDACNGTRPWLRSFGHLSVYSAYTTFAKAELLDQLPAVSAAAQEGRISPDHVARLVKLTDDVGVEPVRQVEEILTAVAERHSWEDFTQVCERVRAHADPDGPEPDPEKVLARRGLTLARSGDMVRLRGQLDPEAGAIVMTALDAVMTPPGPDDDRTAAQRRADALVDVCRLPLNCDLLPQLAGNRPQVGLLITPEALFRQATKDGVRPADWIARLGLRFDSDDNTGSDHGFAAAFSNSDDQSATPATGPDHDPATNHHSDADQRPETDHSTTRGGAATDDRCGPAGHADGQPPPGDSDPDPLTAAGIPPLDKGWLTWVGDIATATAQRLACDSILHRVIYDPATGQPLDVGRSYRTAPHWIRRALHARDRGCRWPGCTAPTPWTDAHHLTMWRDGGETRADRMALLCRRHHVFVHEGHWTIHMHPRTGEVRVTRPNGQPYELEPTPSWLRRPG